MGYSFKKMGDLYTPFKVSQMTYFKESISKKLVYFAFIYRIFKKSVPLWPSEVKKT
jgi:hypothetical protein